jgi:hypothetical protein
LSGLIFIGVGYVAALAFFRFLGGFRSAGEAFERWGRATAEQRRRETSSS